MTRERARGEVTERARVAEAVEALPDLTAALRNGEPSWSAARELTRVVVDEEQREGLGGSSRRAR